MDNIAQLGQAYEEGGTSVSIAELMSDVPHPGEFIRDEIEARGWAERDLAYILGVQEQAINPIMSGKRGISPDMAQSLSKAFGLSAGYFLNLQKAYELSTQPDLDRHMRGDR